MVLLLGLLTGSSAIACHNPFGRVLAYRASCVPCCHSSCALVDPMAWLNPLDVDITFSRITTSFLIGDSQTGDGLAVILWDDVQVLK